MPRIFFPSSRPTFIDERKIIVQLRELARKIARKNRNIEGVYLFGSYACGNAGLRSDADILVILRQDRRSKMERLDEFILAFSDGPVPVDVLVYTRGELSIALRDGNRFLATALEGIKLV